MFIVYTFELQIVKSCCKVIFFTKKLQKEQINVSKSYIKYVIFNFAIWHIMDRHPDHYGYGSDLRDWIHYKLYNYLKSLLTFQGFSFASLIACWYPTLSSNSWPAVVHQWWRWWWRHRTEWSISTTIKIIVHLRQACHMVNIMGLGHLCATVLQCWDTGPLVVHTSHVMTLHCWPDRMNDIVMAFPPIYIQWLPRASRPTIILRLWTPRQYWHDVVMTACTPFVVLKV